jgi:hypothetical protein
MDCGENHVNLSVVATVAWIVVGVWGVPALIRLICRLMGH